MPEPYSTADVGATVAVQAELALQTASRWATNFPRPPAGQGVRADKLLEVVAKLAPLASDVLALPVGSKKGGYSGAGYLTGATISKEDHQVANAVMYEIKTRLPSYGSRPVEPWLLAQIKGITHRLLMIATDVGISQANVSFFAQAWDSLSDAFRELPETLGRVTGEIARGAGAAAGSFAGGVAGGLGLTGLLIGGGLVAGLLLLRR